MKIKVYFILVSMVMVWNNARGGDEEVVDIETKNTPSIATEKLSIDLDSTPDPNKTRKLNSRRRIRCEYIYRRSRCDKTEDCRWSERRRRCVSLPSFLLRCSDIRREERCERLKDCRWSKRRDKCMFRDTLIDEDFDCEDIEKKRNCERTRFCRWSDSRDKCMFRDTLIDEDFDCEDIEKKRNCERTRFCRWSDSRDKCVYRDE